MYAYCIDQRLAGHHQKKLATIRSQLKRRGLAAEYSECSTPTEFNEFVVKNTTIGTKTFVAIGDDTTFHTLLNTHYNPDNAYGFVPLVEKSEVASLFGLSSYKHAIGTLAQRKVSQLPVIQANHFLVISSLRLHASTNHKINLKVDGQLEISAEANHLVIHNSRLAEKNQAGHFNRAILFA